MKYLFQRENPCKMFVRHTQTLSYLNTAGEVGINVNKDALLQFKVVAEKNHEELVCCELKLVGSAYDFLTNQQGCKQEAWEVSEIFIQTRM